MPIAPAQPSPAPPAALVVAEGPLQRHRLGRRLARGGLGVAGAVDPLDAADATARARPDVVLWASPRTEARARRLLLPGGGPAPGGPRAVLLLDALAPGARVAAALAAGFDDAIRAGAPWTELVARVRAAAARGRELARVAAGAAAFRELADGSRDLLARHAPDGTVLYASRAARELLGHDPADLVGRGCADLWHPDEVDLARLIQAGAAEAGPHLHRLRRRDGGWAWMETTARVVRDAAGRVREVRTDSRDVTERVRAERERDALARLTAAVAGGIDLDRLLARAAEEAAGLLGVPDAAVVRVNGDEGVVVAAAGRSMRPGDPVPLVPRDGRTVSAPVAVADRPWGLLLARGSVARGPGEGERERLGRLAALVSLGIANAEARERLLALATTDPLTGLANHRVFHERLRAEMARSRRTGAPVSLVLIDLDRFKRVNDVHGHQVGDEVLREVARRMAEGAREADVVARLGGEELAWLLPDAGLEAAVAAAERLRRRIGGEPMPAVGRQTASFGVATVRPGDEPADVVRRADRALYLAKERGRDACVAETALGEVTGARSA